MKKPGPLAPVAVRPNNIDEQPEPKRTYRKAHHATPFEREQRVASFKRNRERVLRERMRR